MVKNSTCEVVLIRHAHSTANLKGILAGRNNRVGLSPRGKREALAIADRLSGVHFDAIYSSPLKRCLDTISPFISERPPYTETKVNLVEDLIEMEYGQWSGKPLRQLSKNVLWKSIQNRPSTVRFPNGESFMEMSTRANQAVLRAADGRNRIAIVSHGDVIKAIVAFHLGMSLDTFQRISVDPASVTILRIPSSQVILLNSTSHLSSPISEARTTRDRFTLGGGQGRL